MRFYRVYGLDRADCIEAIRLISADDDSDALRQAQSECGSHALEVWDQSRRIGRIVAPDAAILVSPAMPHDQVMSDRVMQDRAVPGAAPEFARPH